MGYPLAPDRAKYWIPIQYRSYPFRAIRRAFSPHRRRCTGRWPLHEVLHRNLKTSSFQQRCTVPPQGGEVAQPAGPAAQTSRTTHFEPDGLRGAHAVMGLSFVPRQIRWPQPSAYLNDVSSRFTARLSLNQLISLNREAAPSRLHRPGLERDVPWRDADRERSGGVENGRRTRAPRRCCRCEHDAYTGPATDSRRP